MEAPRSSDPQPEGSGAQNDGDGAPRRRISDLLSAQDRWLAAMCYLGPLALIGVGKTGKSEFLTRHAQQGFTLFLAEAAILCLLLILDNTVGRIPLLGFLLMVVLELGVFVGFLVLSLLGFVKGLAGEEYRIPVLEDYAEKIPVAE